MMFSCPCCGCEEVAWAAPLGRIVHARCRACGIEYHAAEVAYDDPDDPDDDE